MIQTDKQTEKTQRMRFLVAMCIFRML